MSVISYKLRDALSLVLNSASAKFVESVDVVLCLGVDPKKSENQVRGTVVLPHGIGKDIKVAVFGAAYSGVSPHTLGVEVIGGNELVESIKSSGVVPNVDWCITSPDFMPTISKIAKILGPKGLMPSPKFGSVTSDILGTVKKIKSGQIKFKTDKNAIIHAKIGDVSFSIEKLAENYTILVESVASLKPACFGGLYIKHLYLNSTMGGSYRVA